MEFWPGANWELADDLPGAVDRTALQATVGGLQQRETSGSRDMRGYLGAILEAQPFPDVLGPVEDGSGASGVCVHQGQLIAAWGDPAAVEMSFSVTKTYLSVLTGIAVDRGLIDVHEPVAATVDHHAFSGPRHAAITWEHLLHQTSEWRGTLWGLPWWADPQGGQEPDDPPGEPGSTWAYNDVRINLLALALLHMFARPLPDVLASEVMQPIRASGTWQWHGYNTSDTILNGQQVRSVSGGAHWGGGLWASAYDHARVGLLYLRGGRWEDRRVISEHWVRSSWRPCAVKPDYGYLWRLNDRATLFPSAPPSGRCARGNDARQLIWIDPVRDLVVVSRWTEDVDRLLAGVSKAVRPSSPIPTK